MSERKRKETKEPVTELRTVYDFEEDVSNQLEELGFEKKLQPQIGQWQYRHTGFPELKISVDKYGYNIYVGFYYADYICGIGSFNFNGWFNTLSSRLDKIKEIILSARAIIGENEEGEE